MSIVDRKYWLLSIAAGLAVGLLAMLVNLLIGDWRFMSDASRIVDRRLYFIVESALHIVGPALFGAVFVYCLRSTIGTNWWRGLCLLLVIVAAHDGAFFLVVKVHALTLDLVHALTLDLPSVAGRLVPAFILVPAFTYGATFALVVAAVAALLFPPARSAWLVAVTVLASGLVALSYWPLEDIVPKRGLFISEAAAWVTFGFVYAVVAALLGWRLFEKKTVTDA